MKPVWASNQALTVWEGLKFETHFGFQGALRALNEGENLDPSWVLTGVLAFKGPFIWIKVP